MTLPALYLSHGAPPLLDDQLWISQLKEWSGTIEKPKGILVVSAHWYFGATAVTGQVITIDGGHRFMALSRDVQFLGDA